MSYKILVVDDEESIRFTFNEFLTEEGHEVFCADSFQAAMDIISESELDLIFADIILAEHTGIDILKAVRDRGLLCPVIIVTGQPNIDTATESVRLGAFDYLVKPIHQDKLLWVTKVALSHKQVIGEREQYRNNLDAIFRSVMDAIITVDEQMHVIESNAAVEAVCGVAPGDIAGKHFISIDNLCLAACGDVLQQALNHQATIREQRIECHHPGRPRQMLIVNASPLLDRKNNSIGAILVIRDVTRMSMMECELKERHSFHNIIGKSPRMQRMYQIVDNLSEIETTVLITGESGTGKELFAKALHYNGPRAFRSLVTVNCSTLVENLLESELFGHVKGAFTGAIRDKIGRFQEAHKGTIFLDEVGDLSPVTQLKLLRVLQEKCFERVGDSTPIEVDVRVIGATNRDLRHEVRQGRFREDLYYRLKVVEIELPPLRERYEDVPLLVKHFCDLYSRKFNKPLHGAADDAMEVLMQYPWPGNVRELEHAIERAFVFCRNESIGMEHLPPEISRFQGDRLHTGQNNAAELDTVVQTLERTDGNKAKAARLLGISRKTLYKKLRKLPGYEYQK
ncbi:MAG: sigma 54-interacting transcriptional regulator [Desulfobacteraceae bacterium]|nr:sigma 54-interacting transcriptional regulator [Desulfobacteraceae bacterium]